MELRSQSVRRAVDSIPAHTKKTGRAAAVEVIAYPDGHAAFAGHPLNGAEELLAAVGYLFERLHREAQG